MNIGNAPVIKLYVGATQVQKMYRGAQQTWPTEGESGVTNISFNEDTPAGKGGVPVAGTSIMSGDPSNHWEINNSGMLVLTTTGAATITATDQYTLVTDSEILAITINTGAHLRADEFSSLSMLTAVSRIQIRDVTDRSLVAVIPSGLVFTNPTTLEAENWTMGTSPDMTTSAVKIGRILYYTDTTPLTNLTIQGFDCEWLSNLGSMSMIQIGTPTRMCAIKHCRCVGPNLTLERTSGRLAAYTHPKVNGIHVGNDANGNGSGRHYGIVVEKNFVGEVTAGINFQSASNDGATLATLRSNVVNGFHQRFGILQYLDHKTTYGSSGVTTKSNAPCGVVIEDNIGINCTADLLDSSKIDGNPTQLAADRIHAAVIGINQRWNGVRFLGNKFAIGPRLSTDYPANNGTATTGVKFNDPADATSYQNIDIGFNIILATGITLEVSGGNNIHSYFNTIQTDPWEGSSAAVYMSGVENLKLYNNIMQITDATPDTLYGVVTEDTWQGYGNIKVSPAGAYGTSSEFGTINTLVNIFDYWNEWMPQNGSRIAALAVTPGALGNGLYVPGSGTDSAVYNLPISTATNTATLNEVVLNGTQGFSWSGSFGDFFETNAAAATLIMWVKSPGTGNMAITDSQSNRIDIEFYSRRLQVQFKNNTTTQMKAISTQRVPADGEYHLVVMSATAGRVIFSLDGVLDPFPSQTWYDTLSWTWRSNAFYLFRNFSNGDKFNGSIRALAVDNTFIDIETNTGYAQIHDNTGGPRDPGVNGANWFGGTTPGIFMRGDATTFTTNTGRLTNLVLSGTL